MNLNLGFYSLRDHILSYHTIPPEADKPGSPMSVGAGTAMLHTAKQLRLSGLGSAFSFEQHHSQISGCLSGKACSSVHLLSNHDGAPALPQASLGLNTRFLLVSWEPPCIPTPPVAPVLTLSEDPAGTVSRVSFLLLGSRPLKFSDCVPYPCASLLLYVPSL